MKIETKGFGLLTETGCWRFVGSPGILHEPTLPLVASQRQDLDGDHAGGALSLNWWQFENARGRMLTVILIIEWTCVQIKAVGRHVDVSVHR